MRKKTLFILIISIGLFYKCSNKNSNENVKSKNKVASSGCVTIYRIPLYEGVIMRDSSIIGCMEAIQIDIDEYSFSFHEQFYKAHGNSFKNLNEIALEGSTEHQDSITSFLDVLAESVKVKRLILHFSLSNFQFVSKFRGLKELEFKNNNLFRNKINITEFLLNNSTIDLVTVEYPSASLASKEDQIAEIKESYKNIIFDKDSISKFTSLKLLLLKNSFFIDTVFRKE